jgi:phosphoglycerate dehydrogenase-like enzyme
VRICLASDRGRDFIGDLPEGTEVVVADQPHGCEFWVPPVRPPGPLDGDLSALRVVQLVTAGADAWLGRLPERVTLCGARGVHTSSTSEWAVAAILSSLREFPRFARAQVAGEWAPSQTDELAGKQVMIVGAGAIGEAIAARLAPFEVSLTLVARRPRDGVHGLDELPALLPAADVVVLVVPLTSQTTGLVDAAFLAAMPDGALLVNAARGPVVDTAALAAELITGRIAAALDVTDPEPLPTDSPLWTLPNVLLTPHVGGAVRGVLRRAYALAGDQLRRYAAGEPLINIVHGEY